ncbi:hypothetical protein IC582_011883 [Cucumis melo]
MISSTLSTRLEKGKKKLGKAAVNCQQLEGEKVLRLCKMLKRFLNIKEYRFKSKTPIELKGACWSGGRILSPSFRDTMAPRQD